MYLEKKNEKSFVFGASKICLIIIFHLNVTAKNFCPLMFLFIFIFLQALNCLHVSRKKNDTYKKHCINFAQFQLNAMKKNMMNSIAKSWIYLRNRNIYKWIWSLHLFWDKKRDILNVIKFLDIKIRPFPWT